MFHRPNLETLESSLTIARPLSPVVRKLPNLVDSFLVMNLKYVSSISAIHLIHYFIITACPGYLK